MVHSAVWALAFGDMAGIMRQSLEGGITMAATRFRMGDEFTMDDYRETAQMQGREDSVIFCEQLKEMLGDKICCLPCKDLSHVELLRL